MPRIAERETRFCACKEKHQLKNLRAEDMTKRVCVLSMWMEMGGGKTGQLDKEADKKEDIKNE